MAETLNLGWTVRATMGSTSSFDHLCCILLWISFFWLLFSVVVSLFVCILYTCLFCFSFSSAFNHVRVDIKHVSELKCQGSEKVRNGSGGPRRGEGRGKETADGRGSRKGGAAAAGGSGGRGRALRLDMRASFITSSNFIMYQAGQSPNLILPITCCQDHLHKHLRSQ